MTQQIMTIEQCPLNGDTTLLLCLVRVLLMVRSSPPTPKDITLSVDMNCYTGTASAANGVYERYI